MFMLATLEIGITGSVRWMGTADPYTKFSENIRKSFVICPQDFFSSWMFIRTAFVGRILAFTWLTTFSSIGRTARITRAPWFRLRTAMPSIIDGGTRARSRPIRRRITIIVILPLETRICTGYGSGRRCEIEGLGNRGVGILLIYGLAMHR